MAQALNSLHPTFGTANAPSSSAAALTSTTLAVENMHCGNCIRNVEQALSVLPGVIGARANLSAQRVTVLTSAMPETAEPFINALREVGFPATLLADADAAPKTTPQQDYLKRLGVAGFASANVMLLSVSVWSGFGSDMPASLQAMFHWLSAIVAIPAIAYSGQPFFKSARQALAASRVNMDVPISLGVILATSMSLFQTIRGTEHVYFDAAVMLLFFLLIGRTLDERMRARAVSAAENLLGMRTAVASVVRADGRVERIAANAIQPGMTVLIAAGERVPVDARIVRGSGDIDDSLMTGESIPRHLKAGDQLYAGTIALSGPLEAVATAVAENTLLAEIARLMQSAEQARGRYVRLADRAARLYAPAVHILGLGTFIGWMLSGYGWEPALTAAIAVLIITCPCALALAVPAVQVVATARLFRNGVVLKAADGLERLAEVDTIVLDKTGTLTLGRPQLTAPDTLPDAVLARAAALASQSRHPYAKAVVRAAEARGLAIAAAADVTEVAGAGLRAVVDGQQMRLGSATFCGVDHVVGAQHTLWLREGTAAAIPLAVHDELRADARQVVAKLAASGYQFEIVSGDRADAVADAAVAVGISQWLAGQHPDDKIARINELSATGRRVLMIGDGLNDAPALAAGHAALSPSSAADISQTAADAVFRGKYLAPVVETLAVAKAARRRSLENFAIAIGYNLLFVPLAMAGLVTPLIAAIAMSASSIAVTANALRLSNQTLEA